MATILVTGGAGYVGSHCAKALASSGHTPVVFDSLLYGDRDFVRWGDLVVGDIRDGAALDRAIADYKPDAVMHFAALAYVGESVEEPSKYYDVNVTGTQSLLDAMRRADLDKIVFSSSCAIYGQPERSPITEDMEHRPLNPYGYTKSICERMIGDYGHAYGLGYARLRYFNAAGADPQGLIGESHDPETHLIPLVLDAAIGKRPHISIFGTDYDTPDGTAIRDYIHVEDLALAHAAALDRLLKGGSSLSVNLGGGAGVSVREVITAAERVTGKNIAVKETERRPGDPASLVADVSLAERLLGWRPSRSDLDTILIDAWRWHQERHQSPSRA